MSKETTAKLLAIINREMNENEIDTLKEVGMLNARGLLVYHPGRFGFKPATPSGYAGTLEFSTHPTGQTSWPVRIVRGAQGWFADRGIYKSQETVTDEEGKKRTKTYKEYPDDHMSAPAAAAFKKLVEKVIIPYLQADGTLPAAE